MNLARRALPWVIGVELVAALLLIAWRLTRPALFEVNLSRLAPSTAAEVRRLERAVWTDTAAAWREVGEAYLAFGYFAEAEMCLKRASDRRPQDFTTRFEHACSLERLGRLEAANAEFSAASSLGSGSQVDECHFRIARNWLRLEQVGPAEAAFARASTFPPAQCEFARLLVRTGRAEAALPILTTMRSKLPLDVRTEMVAVQAYRELERPREAGAAVERAQRAQVSLRFTDHWQQLYAIRTRYGLMAGLSRVEQLSQSRQHRQAADEFNRLFAAVSWDFMEQVVTTGVQLDLNAKRAPEALDKLERLSVRMDLGPEANRLRGDALAAMGRREEATEVWQKAGQLQPTAATHRTLATAFAARGQHAAAEAQRAAAQVQSGIEAYYANDLDMAQRKLEDARQKASDNPRVWYYLGQTYSAQDRIEAAIAAFWRCRAINALESRARERIAELAE